MELLEYKPENKHSVEVLEKWIKDLDGKIYRLIRIGGEWTPFKTPYKEIPFIKINLSKIYR